MKLGMPRTRQIAVVAIVATCAGCDRLFGLEHVPDPSSVTDDGGQDDGNRPVDAPPCDELGHDEDVDGSADTCDACPTFYNPGDGDNDTDGLPDACDRDDAATGADRIDTYWTFPTDDVSSFDMVGSPLWTDTNNGMLIMPYGTTVTTKMSFVPTRVELHLSGTMTTNVTSELYIRLAGVTVCKFQGASCAGTGAGTCVRVGSTASTWPMPASAARRIALFREGNRVACEISDGTNAPMTVSEPGGIVASTVGFATTATASTNIEALVIYAAK